MTSFKTLRLLLLLTLSFSFFQACKDSAEPSEENLVKNYDRTIAFEWSQEFLKVERYAAGYRPGPAPRALAYMGLSAYEACITGMPEYNSLENLFVGLNIPDADPNAEYHWPTVVNASYGYLMPRFFANVRADLLQDIQDLKTRYEREYSEEVSPAVFERSKAYGEAVALAIWEWSKTDAVGHDHYLDPFQGYNWEEHFDSDGDWKPTFPGPGKPMGGVWGKARTFAIKETDKLARPPLAYSASPTSALYAQAMEVYAQNTPTLSYENEWVGEFWSDDLLDLTFSPGPRWIAVGDQVLVNDNHNLETALYMHAKVGLALNDASVACWHSKYYYNVERPQTYINRVIDPSWKPALYNPLTGAEGVTPSFPAYPSGHSTMGAAGAEALASIFGYSYSLTDRDRKSVV